MQVRFGCGKDRKPLEIDLVARAADDPDVMLCGEAKVSAGARDITRALEELHAKVQRCPVLEGKQVHCALWVLHRQGRVRRRELVSGKDVVSSSVGG